MHAARSGRDPELSIVVPVFNEEANVAPLAASVRDALGDEMSWELLFVDDGSVDGTASAVHQTMARDPRVRLVGLARNYGQTAAMQAGFDLSRGRVVVTMDGDLQNDPADIPRMLEKLEQGFDLVTGNRTRRRDRAVTRRFPSWAANRVVRWITGVDVNDTGCTLKAYRRELLERLNLYSDLHRFIPAVAAATTGARIAEIEVSHHPRRSGASKYGVGRVLRVIADLLTITMIRSFRHRPLVMFGWGAAFAFGLATLSAATGLVALLAYSPDQGPSVVLPAGSVLWAGLACYLLLLGLVAEVILRKFQRQNGERTPLAREVVS